VDSGDINTVLTKNKDYLNFDTTRDNIIKPYAYYGNWFINSVDFNGVTSIGE
jgi:hypothetical protein